MSTTARVETITESKLEEAAALIRAGQLVAYLQLQSLLGLFQVRWPPDLLAFFKGLRFLQVDFTGPLAYCTQGYSFGTRIAMQWAVVWGGLALTLVAYAAYKYCGCLPRGPEAREDDRFEAMLLA